MAEIEYGGIKVGGSKLLLIIPLLGTIGGGLWAGFEFYKDYMDMKEQIQEYVAPDLSGFDKRIAVMNEHMETVDIHMDFVEKEIGLSSKQASALRSRFQEVGEAQGKAGINAISMQKSFSMLNKEFGVAASTMRDDILVNTVELTKFMGVSDKSAASFSFRIQEMGSLIFTRRVFSLFLLILYSIGMP